MNEAELINSLLGAIGALIALLISIIGWLGIRITKRLDDISAALHGRTLELCGDIAKLDNRVSVVETKAEALWKANDRRYHDGKP